MKYGYLKANMMFIKKQSTYMYLFYARLRNNFN